jgi:hypothetical protein
VAEQLLASREALTSSELWLEMHHTGNPEGRENLGRPRHRW